MQQLQQIRCPMCNSKNFSRHTTYTVQSGEQRELYHCDDCGDYFSETKNTPLAGLHRPLSLIIMVLDALNDGMSINAACRTFHVNKNSIKRWLKRLASVKETLLLYALCHQFLQQLIEGDELYTRVHHNKPPQECEGWTLVLMDRATRFIWELRCGERERGLFESAMQTLSQVIEQTGDLTLLTDGERRYGNLCSKYARKCSVQASLVAPRRCCPKGSKFESRTKAHKRTKEGANDPSTKRHGMNTPKLNKTWKTTRFMPIILKASIALCGGRCRAIGARQTRMLKNSLLYKQDLMRIGCFTTSSVRISPPSKFRQWPWAFWKLACP